MPRASRRELRARPEAHPQAESCRRMEFRPGDRSGARWRAAHGSDPARKALGRGSRRSHPRVAPGVDLGAVPAMRTDLPLDSWSNRFIEPADRPLLALRTSAARRSTVIEAARNVDRRPRIATAHTGGWSSLPNSCVAMVLAAVLAVACGRARPPCGAPSDEVIDELTEGSLERVADRLHEPPSWDAHSAEQDRRDLAHQLAFMVDQFGGMSSVVPVTSEVPFLHLGISGGDVPYWQSLPNQGVDASTVHRVSFAKVGPGVVALTFIRNGDRCELRSIELGIEPSQAGASEKMMAIGRRSLEQFQPALDPETRERALEAMFGSEGGPSPR